MAAWKISQRNKFCGAAIVNADQNNYSHNCISSDRRHRLVLDTAKGTLHMRFSIFQLRSSAEFGRKGGHSTPALLGVCLAVIFEQGEMERSRLVGWRRFSMGSKRV